MANKNDLGQSLDLNKYNDRSGLTVKKLNFGLWVASHKKQFILGVIGVLIGISAIFYGYAIYGYVDYMFFGGKREREAVEEIINAPTVSEEQRIKNLAKELEPSSVNSFINNAKYDFLAQVNNPNDNFYASIDYCFVEGEKELACGNTFIFPSEKKYLMSLGLSLEHSPVNPKLNLKKVSWQRLNLHLYPDWKAFSAEHLNFKVSNVEFKTAEASGISEKLKLDVLEFTITNNTAYSYWEVPLNIVLLSSKYPVGANRYIVKEFKSGETRKIKMTWADSLSRLDEALVAPEIQIMDDNVYMKYR